MQLHHSTITSITPQGLSYLNFEENEHFIDFFECSKNWILYMNSSKDSEVYLEEHESVCVAWRDAFSKPPYIEFFTEPRIRFVYPHKRSIYEWIMKQRSMQGYAYFRETCDQIRENGWSTFDLG